MEQLSVKQQQMPVWHALHCAAWSNARSSLDSWPVFLVRPTIENGNSIRPFNKRFASSTVALPNCRSTQSTPHIELKQVASLLRQSTRMTFALPSIDPVRRFSQTPKLQPTCQ